MACQLQCTSVQLEQCQEIMKAHKCSLPSPQALWAKLQEGVLVDGNKYFWLDNQARLGVELYARALSITWGSNPEYWTYSCEKIPNTDYSVEVAKLRNVCWLDVNGEFDMRKLTVGAEYEILFDIELTSGAQGWCCPVTFEHNSPFCLSNKFEMKLDNLIGKGRTQISVGKFKLPCLPIGTHTATFHMYEHGDMWKNGLIMRGVVIKPAKLCN
ncbi:hypothetical protein V2J09_015762 [Rumex salicifolius]